MSAATPTLTQVASFLDELLEAPAYSARRGRDGRCDQNGILRASTRPVGRIALALEPWPGMETRWQVGRWTLFSCTGRGGCRRRNRRRSNAGDTGVLAYHLSFDEHLTLGFNPPLAALLGLEMPPEPLGSKEGRPLGMIGCLAAPVRAADLLARLREIFGGLDMEHPGGGEPGQAVKCVAVVGAMNDSLVRQAHERGAGLYVTGQWRQPATAAARDTGMAVAAVGHLRSEEWGLQMLARLLRERLGIKVFVPDALSTV